MVAFRGHSSVVRVLRGHSLELLPYFFGASALLLLLLSALHSWIAWGVDSRGRNKDARHGLVWLIFFALWFADLGCR